LPLFSVRVVVASSLALIAQGTDLVVTPEIKRLLIGIALAPLAPGLLMLPLVFLGRGYEVFWAMRLFVLISYPTMIVLGLPAHLLLQRLGLAGLWPYVFAGMFAGVVAARVVFHSFFTAMTVIVPLLGAMCGAAFWLIACSDALETRE